MEDSLAILFYHLAQNAIMGLKLWGSGLLVIVGGVLMVASGYSSRGFLFLALGYAANQIPSYFSGPAADAAVVAVSIVELLIGLGGLTVLIGGIFILRHHVTNGRVLIFLGGGAGLLGLLISFGYATLKLGIDPAFSYAPYWLGLVLAVAGRSLAKGA
ncbi:MAG: hypothetical protein OK404_02180 [Thaumarchaeota archaeon]|nr:hypothetical protein [Nitrososphaerota archaeon]